MCFDVVVAFESFGLSEGPGTDGDQTRCAAGATRTRSEERSRHT